MFAKIAVLLVVCLVQVNCEWDFCKCMENTTEAKNAYDTFLKSYAGVILQTQANIVKEFSSEFADMNNAKRCTNDYYKKAPTDFTLDLLILCGGYPLDESFLADWSKLVTDNDVCNFISVRGPQATAMIKLNQEAIPKCSLPDVFFGVMYKQFLECESCSTV